LDVSVVIPTYDEADNLSLIVPRVHRALAAAGLQHEIIIVDDASPDGTAEVARQLGRSFPVRVLVRQERGLATAVLAGFSMSEATVVAVMDADGSHPPERLPDLVTPVLDAEADIVVGSRRVAGGGAEHWPWYRDIISRAAGALAVSLTSLADPTSGFMAARRELVSKLDLDPLGWKIVLELVVKAGPARLREVPITFTDRVHGASKLGLRAQVDYLRHVGRLHAHRRPESAQFVRFCLVGLLGVVVDMLTVLVARELFQLDHRICAAAGFTVAVTHNYVLNRYWTFDRGRQTRPLDSYLAFVATCSVGLLVRLGIVHALVEHTVLGTARWYLVANLVGIAGATVVNFTGARRFAFRAPRGGGAHRA